MRYLLSVLVFVNISFVYGGSFTDGFEDGMLGSSPSQKNSFFEWDTGVYSQISDEYAYSGNLSLKFTYKGNPDPAEDSWSEQRFKFSELQKDLWIRYKMRVPDNYLHRKPVGPTNNKGLIMLWSDPYSGYSATTSLHFQRPVDATDDNTGGTNPGGSIIYAAWRANSDLTLSFFIDDDYAADWAPVTEYSTGLSVSDRGKWVDWVMHIKVSDMSISEGDMDGPGNGKVQVWKNGTLIYNAKDATNYFPVESENGFTKGYIMGWSNSGYNEDTVFYIDDFAIGNQPSDINFNLNAPVFGPVICDGC
jgi:hypothetical protein